ncbi:hypothetical protein J6590_039253 [Homalodisca vitripennis]|nr:hypothetical protein J6590_039253 [Homalodisca vitripennis]
MLSGPPVSPHPDDILIVRKSSPMWCITKFLVPFKSNGCGYGMNNSIINETEDVQHHRRRESDYWVSTNVSQPSVSADTTSPKRKGSFLACRIVYGEAVSGFVLPQVNLATKVLPDSNVLLTSYVYKHKMTGLGKKRCMTQDVMVTTSRFVYDKTSKVRGGRMYRDIPHNKSEHYAAAAAASPSPI